MNDVSRRVFLVTGVLAAGAAGVGVGYATGHRESPEVRAATGGRKAAVDEPALAAAIEREAQLLARLQHAALAEPTLAATIAVLTRDHRAHAQALKALSVSAGASVSGGASPSRGSSVGAGSSASAPTAPAPSSAEPKAVYRRADLVAWEKAAGRDSAQGCITAGPRLAPLLASISACEATHAAWLA
jgi:hypothetical protein